MVQNRTFAQNSSPGEPMDLINYFSEKHFFEERLVREIEDAIRDSFRLFTLDCFKFDLRIQKLSSDRLHISGYNSISTLVMTSSLLDRMLSVGNWLQGRASNSYDCATLFSDMDLSDPAQPGKRHKTIANKLKELNNDHIKTFIDDCLFYKKSSTSSRRDHYRSLFQLTRDADQEKPFPLPETLPILCWSNNYGMDDPGALGWLWDLAKNCKHETIRGDLILDFIAYSFFLHCYELNKPTMSSGAKRSSIFLSSKLPGETIGESSYTALRFARLFSGLRQHFSDIKSIGERIGDIFRDNYENNDAITTTLSERKLHRGIFDNYANTISSALFTMQSDFENSIRLQLSYVDIPDSRFDPAELIFCLEGLLLLKPKAVEHSLFERIISVLHKSQDTTPYWRAETPLRSTHRGLIQLPIGIEAASSLLCSLSLYDGSRRLHVSRAAIVREMLERVWRWLKSRRIAFQLQDLLVVKDGVLDKSIPAHKKDAGQFIHGWQSEYTYEPDTITVWETTQVLEFLLSLRHFLLRDIGRNTLRVSGVYPEWPTQNPLFLTTSSRINNTNELEIMGDSVVQSWCPSPAGNAELQPFSVYRRVIRDFAFGRHPTLGRAKKEYGRYWSALIYGPPGTGKTNIAKNIAMMLDWPYIELSVSDFLEEGPARMEARAKALFRMLESQPKSVVLFDEFDVFTLDRESKLFEDQDSQFKLITNGMLPKFQKLREAERVIFFLATNYKERIDPAIARKGRFDQDYLMLPRFWDARSPVIFDGLSGLERTLPQDLRDFIRSQSAFLLFQELKEINKDLDAAVSKNGVTRGKPLEILIRSVFEKRKPRITPESYTDRFSSFNHFDRTRFPLKLQQTPFEEYLGMCMIHLEAGLDVTILERSTSELLKSTGFPKMGGMAIDVLVNSGVSWLTSEQPLTAELRSHLMDVSQRTPST